MIYSKLLEEYKYSCVNMSYIHVPKTLSDTRRNSKHNQSCLETLRIQPQTGKILEVHICKGKNYNILKLIKKAHTHTKMYCLTFRIDLITISK